MALNERQKLFVKEYLVDKNATEAAKRAGYSPKTAHSQGPRLLEHVEICEAINTHLNKTHEKLDITVERIEEELASMAFQDMSKETMVERLKSGFQYKDKTKALELLGKHKAMFTDKIDANVTGDLSVSVIVKGHKV